ncbi:MAG: ribbon-helix-helix protein, CopG family [Candidatus Hydrogenedentes bacterium]|nr:ribbon-helix-helix protein, CopG family [Candidatus Hydrogenedentota bacterium]
MTKRLQVLLPETEMESLRKHAKDQNLTVGEYVRRALRQVQARRPVAPPAQKLAALQQALKFSFPVADIDQINREIEQGYLR